jgi:hypothetical protein
MKVMDKNQSLESILTQMGMSKEEQSAMMASMTQEEIIELITN